MALTQTHRQVVYRLLPQTAGNWQWLETTLEAQRQLYNAALEERIDFRRKTGKSRTYFDQCKALTACRAELPDMAGCGIAIQRGTLKRLDEAFKGFLSRLKKGGKSGFPKFKGKAFFDSIAIVSGVKVRDGTLHIPGFGPMAIRRKGGNPHPDGRPVSAVLKACRRQVDRRRLLRRGDRGACRQRTRARPRPELRTGRRQRRGTARHAGHVQARRQGEAAAAQAVAPAETVEATRADEAAPCKGPSQDCQPPPQTGITMSVKRLCRRRAGAVAVETLDVKAMTKSAKGTVEEPGTNVPQKAGLNRVILNTGWTALKRMLDYKAANVITVPARNTSRTCHECGAAESRQPQNSGRLHLRCLRARGTCRHQRGKEHPVRGAWPRPGTRGVRDWRVCTARGVRAADLTDP